MLTTLPALWTAEWIVIGFFAYLLVLCLLRPLPSSARRRILLVSAVCVAAPILLAGLRPSPALQIIREWIPGLYLMQGYWLCGLFFRAPMPGVERRLLALDAVAFDRTRLRGLLARAPRAVASWFELAYLLAYPFVPAAFGALVALGERARADEFWTALLGASYACYGMLPWIQTRSPRTLATDRPLYAPHHHLRRMNATVLNRMSVQWNTFPSGHAASATAAALAVASAGAPLPAAAFVLIAASITVATVLGRYHYLLDTILGLAIGIAAWQIAGIVT